jgi:hypothetical protein
MAAPVFTDLDDTPSYTENSIRVMLDGDATIADADFGPSDPFTGATLTLVRNGGASPDDQFGALGSTLSDGQVLVTETDGNGDSTDVAIGSYVIDGGMLTIVFNEEATAARINTVLQRLTYSNSSEAPPASVQISYTFDNGEQATGSITVAITAANDQPSIDQLNGSAIYTPGSAAVVLSPAVVISDIDSPMLSQATVTITNGFDAGDILSADAGSAGINVNYAPGVLTLSGAATLEQYREVLATVAYSSSNPDPGANGPRSLLWQITDSDGLASEISGSTLDFTPALDLDASGAGTGFATSFTEGGSAVAIVDTDVAITTGNFISGATVILTNAQAGDTLSASGAGIPFTIDTSTPGQIRLIFSGDRSPDQYQTALAAVRFDSPGDAPVGGVRDIIVSVADANNNTSNLTHASITVTSVNDPGSATDDTASTERNVVLQVVAADGVLANDSDPDGLVVTTGTVATTQGGSIQLASDGSYTYTPPTDFDGTDTVAYSAQDPFGNTVGATLSITVIAVNHPGSAADDTAATQANTVLQVGAADGVLANDNDPDGLAVTTGNAATSQGGSIQFAADGSYTYTPPTDFSGTDTVGYTAEDSFGDEVSATLTITVGPQVGTPGNDSYNAAAGSSAINAGYGVDTITFGFALIDATVTYTGNTVVIDGPSSHTVLTGFETFVFTDGTVNNNDGNVLVDDLFYYSQNHDVWNAHIDAEAHYNGVGWHEGRDPNAFFSTLIYLSANPDVEQAGVNPLTHFDQSGWKEGRVPSLDFDPAHYLAANPDVAAADIDPLLHFLAVGAGEGRAPSAPTELIAANGFDYVYYLQNNPDVAAAHVDPFWHFQNIGWHEGRDPNALFDTAGYLANYVDVAAANINPLDHYHLAGWQEGRDPSVDFDTTSYLAAYPDVAAAHTDPLAHYLQFGQHEGRQTFADGTWS